VGEELIEPCAWPRWWQVMMTRLFPCQVETSTSGFKPSRCPERSSFRSLFSNGEAEGCLPFRS
jgi:hypothetical protein